MVFITSGFVAIVSFIILFVGVREYKLREGKGLVPVGYHPYTKKPNRKLFYEFLRMLMFICIAIGVMAFGFPQFAVFVVLIAGVQGFIFWVELQEVKNQLQVKDQGMELIYSETDLEEWRTKAKDKGKAYKQVEKIVLQGDKLYWGKRQSILLRDRMYKYMFLHRVEREEDFFIIKFGFLGTPMKKRAFYVPDGKQKAFQQLEKRMKEEFTRKKLFSPRKKWE